MKQTKKVKNSANQRFSRLLFSPALSFCRNPLCSNLYSLIFSFICSVALRAFITVAMAASTAALVPVAALKGPEGIDLYSRFALAGALGCSVTHGAFTPVDV